uniref:Uncharacterized protein n=1 Tax=Arundo donax TaxID=35708 RepID=A0A0A9GTG8_ARUDO
MARGFLYRYTQKCNVC